MFRNCIIVVLCLVIDCMFGQKIRFLNAENQSPMKQLLILNSKKSFLGQTDENGAIEKSILAKEKRVLISHPSIDTDTLYVDKIQNDTYHLKPTKVYKIPEIIISKTQKDYLVIEGFFNGFVTNDGVFNIYIDGIIQYVFSVKSKKLEKQILKEYRSFVMESRHEVKKINDIIFDNIIRLPHPKRISNILKPSFKKHYHPLENETSYSIHRQKFNEKEWKFLGYVFYQWNFLDVYRFSGKSTSPQQLSGYDETFTFKLKHKKDKHFTQITSVAHFYPAEVKYLNKNELSKGLKFNRKKSNYRTQFWTEPYFNTTYQLLYQQFNSNLREMPNEN